MALYLDRAAKEQAKAKAIQGVKLIQHPHQKAAFVNYVNKW
jgi:hypothetical protein